MQDTGDGSSHQEQGDTREHDGIVGAPSHLSEELFAEERRDHPRHREPEQKTHADRAEALRERM